MKKKLISILIILAIFIGSGALMFGQNYESNFFNELQKQYNTFFNVNATINIFNENKVKMYHSNGNVYISTGAIKEVTNLANKKNTDIGTFMAMVVAHEYGHVLQYNNYSDFNSKYKKDSVPYEQQADCIMGYVTNKAEGTTPDGIKALFKFLKKGNPVSHGSIDERVMAYNVGFFAAYDKKLSEAFSNDCHYSNFDY